MGCRTPLSEDQPRVQYAHGQARGQYRACGFEPAKALSRGIRQLPRLSPFQGRLPSVAIEESW